MFDGELTSEDKLLKIIENPSALKKEDPSAFFSGGFSFQNLALLLKSTTFTELLQRIPLRVVNKAVFVLCGVLTVACLVNFRSSSKKFEEMYHAMSVAVPQEAALEKKSIADNMNFQQTLTMSKEHNIFTLDHPGVSSEGLMVGQSQEIANLKLVGIMWSEKPQAMIEDVIEKKTYLLNVGEKAGKLTVKEILKDKVILGREDHIWELR